QHRKNDVNLVGVGARGVQGTPAGCLVEVCDLPQTRHSASDSAFQLVQLAGVGAGGKKIDLHQCWRLGGAWAGRRESPASYGRGHAPYRNIAKSLEPTQEEKSKVHPPAVGMIEPLLFLGDRSTKIWQCVSRPVVGRSLSSFKRRAGAPRPSPQFMGLSFLRSASS